VNFSFGCLFSDVFEAFLSSFPSSGTLQTDCSQGTHTREVVSSHGQHKQLINLFQAAHHDLANGAEVNPASFARRRISPTVVGEAMIARAISRWLRPSATDSRKTSKILRMDNLL
jgi:hypothetical protein